MKEDLQQDDSILDPDGFNHPAASRAYHAWTESETQLLRDLITKYGTDKHWHEIAANMPNRTSKQCRDRWTYILAEGINKTKWTPQEEISLAYHHTRIGSKWSKLAAYLPGRTPLSVKNRWHSTSRSKSKNSALRAYIMGIQGGSLPADAYQMAVKTMSKLGTQPEDVEQQRDATNVSYGHTSSQSAASSAAVSDESADGGNPSTTRSSPPGCCSPQSSRSATEYPQDGLRDIPSRTGSMDATILSVPIPTAMHKPISAADPRPPPTDIICIKSRFSTQQHKMLHTVASSNSSTDPSPPHQQPKMPLHILDSSAPFPPQSTPPTTFNLSNLQPAVSIPLKMASVSVSVPDSDVSPFSRTAAHHNNSRQARSLYTASTLVTGSSGLLDSQSHHHVAPPQQPQSLLQPHQNSTFHSSVLDSVDSMDIDASALPPPSHAGIHISLRPPSLLALNNKRQDSAMQVTPLSHILKASSTQRCTELSGQVEIINNKRFGNDQFQQHWPLYQQMDLPAPPRHGLLDLPSFLPQQTSGLQGQWLGPRLSLKNDRTLFNGGHSTAVSLEASGAICGRAPNANTSLKNEQMHLNDKAIPDSLVTADAVGSHVHSAIHGPRLDLGEDDKPNTHLPHWASSHPQLHPTFPRDGPSSLRSMAPAGSNLQECFTENLAHSREDPVLSLAHRIRTQASVAVNHAGMMNLHEARFAWPGRHSSNSDLLCESSAGHVEPSTYLPRNSWSNVLSSQGPNHPPPASTRFPSLLSPNTLFTNLSLLAPVSEYSPPLPMHVPYTPASVALRTTLASSALASPNQPPTTLPLLSSNAAQSRLLDVASRLNAIHEFASDTIADLNMEDVAAEHQMALSTLNTAVLNMQSALLEQQLAESELDAMSAQSDPGLDQTGQEVAARLWPMSAPLPSADMGGSGDDSPRVLSSQK